MLKCNCSEIKTAEMGSTYWVQYYIPMWPAHCRMPLAGFNTVQLSAWCVDALRHHWHHWAPFQKGNMYRFNGEACPSSSGLAVIVTWFYCLSASLTVLRTYGMPFWMKRIYLWLLLFWFSRYVSRRQIYIYIYTTIFYIYTTILI